MKAWAKTSTPPLVVEEAVQEMLYRFDASDQSAKDMLWLAKSNWMAVDELMDWLYAQPWPVSVLDIPRRRR